MTESYVTENQVTRVSGNSTGEKGRAMGKDTVPDTEGAAAAGTPARTFRRALVTGGAGYVGSHICDRLMASGTEVICADDFSTGHRHNIEHLLGTNGFTLLEQNVTKEFDLPGPVDLVLHLASPASLPEFYRRPVDTMLAGSAATHITLEHARRHRARYVLASTSEVYGDPLTHPQQEGYWGNVNPIGPRAVYDEAKRYAEALTVTYGKSYGLSTGIVRIFNSYGPRMLNDGRVIPNFIAQALDGGPVVIHGDGHQTRSPCYVDDTVSGFLAVAHSDVTVPVNIGNVHEISILELAHRVCAAVGAEVPFKHIDRDIDDPERRRPDITRARRELDWEPRVPFDEGLRHTVAALRRHRASA